MATKKTQPKRRLRSSTSEQPPKPYSCKTPPDQPMSLEDTIKLLNSDPDFAMFFANLLCRSNNGDQTASDCISKFYRPTDEELAALCFPKSAYPSLQKCTEQNLLLSPITYGIIGKKGFKPKRG
jgi:hypothetical protein